MNDAVDLAPTISTEATLPASSAADGQSAQARPIADVIAADVYVNNKAAVASNPLFGLRIIKAVTQGAGPARHCGGGGGFDAGWWGGW